MQSDDFDNNDDKTRFHHPPSRCLVVQALPHHGLERHPDDPPVPCLTLRGLWMREAGFHTGGRIHVERRSGVLVLHRDDGERPRGVRVARGKVS